MGNFIHGLAKGFVRSAVNQVGRDAGKVVSNGIYGDSHSTPIRNVSGNSRIVDYGKIEDEQMQVIEPSTKKAVIWCIVGLFFGFIGSIVMLIVGYRKLKNKYTVEAWQYQSQAVYVADGRYKRGMRYDGHNLTRRKIKIEASEYEVEQNEKIAKIYLWFGFITFVLFVTVTMAANGLS